MTDEQLWHTEEPEHAEPERVFAATPPAPGRGFATTWWGQRWLKALEDTALDGQRLRQGRRQARSGAVGAVSVRPGRLTAVVRDADGTSHRADVLLRRLDSAEWDRLLATIAREAGHLAALLDRDMPPALVEDAEAAGVELLPGIGDLEPSCDCGEWDHCAHTAALSYQVARVLDAEPFAILLLRGRTEHEVLADLQRLGAARAEREPGDAGEPAGVPAVEAYRRRVAPLPAPPASVSEPGVPPTLGGGVPPGPGLDVGALEFLAADAALRARDLLAAALDPGPRADQDSDGPDRAGEPGGPEESDGPVAVWRDAARLAAAGPPARARRRLAEGCRRTVTELDMAARAWRFGGKAGLAVLEGEDVPAPTWAAERLARAWPEEESPPVLRGAGGRWTVVGADVQLRCAADGRWWPYRRQGGRWWPAGPPDTDPAAALAAALRGDVEDDGRPEEEP